MSARLPLVRRGSCHAPRAEPEDWTGGNPYNQASPGILVQFAIFGLVTSGQILVQERKTRHPAKVDYNLDAAVGDRGGAPAGDVQRGLFARSLLLVLFGQLVLEVDYLRVPLGTLLISAWRWDCGWRRWDC
ncbi:MAG: hypothetical protein MZU84_07045 [Sphingobacterium sp.]|nr:hypothetical protein [Sphingobacterium sp.]